MITLAVQWKTIEMKKKTTEYLGGHVGTMVGDSSIVAKAP